MLKESWVEGEVVVVLRDCSIQLSVLEASHSRLEPLTLRPGTPLEPGEEAGAVAAAVCSGPCAVPRQTRVGTRAQHLGLWFHAVAHHQPCRKVSLAVLAKRGWE